MRILGLIAALVISLGCVLGLLVRVRVPEAPALKAHALSSAYVHLAPGATRSLVHVVRKAISVMADADAAGAEREMLIALVLTAGDSAGYVALSAALVDASRLPICFVVIGVGAGPFKDLERFDDELGQRAYRGRRPSFAPSPLTSFLLRSLP